MGLLLVRFFEPDGEESYIGRGNPADTGGLPEGLGTYFAEALLRFALEAVDSLIIRVDGQRAGFLAGEAVYLLALAEDMPFIPEVRFDEGP